MLRAGATTCRLAAGAAHPRQRVATVTSVLSLGSSRSCSPHSQRGSDSLGTHRTGSSRPTQQLARSSTRREAHSA
jgi:hypothetical protein